MPLNRAIIVAPNLLHAGETASERNERVVWSERQDEDEEDEEEDEDEENQEEEDVEEVRKGDQVDQDKVKTLK